MASPAFPRAPIPPIRMSIVKYTSNGQWVSEAFGPTETSAFLLQRDRAYPCPLRNFKLSFGQWLQTRSTDADADGPKSLEDLKELGFVLATRSWHSRYQSSTLLQMPIRRRWPKWRASGLRALDRVFGESLTKTRLCHFSQLVFIFCIWFFSSILVTFAGQQGSAPPGRQPHGTSSQQSTSTSASGVH